MISDFLPENRINHSFTSVLYRDNEQNLWCGSGGGICLIDKDGNTAPLLTDGNPFKRNTRAITQTKDGDMWIGTRDHGIIHLRRDGKGFRFMNNGKNRTMYTDISYLFEDSKERLWVGTWGAGLYLITNRDTIGFHN